MNNMVIKAVKNMTHVDRNEFLRKTFPKTYVACRGKDHLPSPAQLVVKASVLKQKAESVIRKHKFVCASISGGLGIPGGAGMAASIPADLAQFYGHLLVVAQKIGYIYGMQDLSQADDQTEYECLIALLYIMMGQTLNRSLSNVLKNCTKPFVRTVFQNRGGKEVFQRVMEFAVTKIGGEMLTKKGISRVASKLIPGISAGVSFGLTWMFFDQGCNRLLKHFERELVAVA